MLKTSQWVLYFLETRQRLMQIFLLQLNVAYQARSFRVLPNLQSSYILCYIRIQCGSFECVIANCFLHFPDFVPFFFSLSLWLCRRVCRLSWPLFSVRNDQTNPVWVSILFPYFSSLWIYWFVYTCLSSTLQDETYAFWATLSLFFFFFYFPYKYRSGGTCI
jgi:hypothetical protein